VPFSYPMSILYMATRDPAIYRFPTWAYIVLVRQAVTSELTSQYLVWATAYYMCVS